MAEKVAVKESLAIGALFGVKNFCDMN